LRDAFPEHDYGRDLPEVVSVTFKPEALTAYEEWRMFLVRVAPASKRPVLSMVLRVLYLLLALPFLGYLIGSAGSPGLQPETMAVAGFAAGLLIPFRIWRTKNTLIKALRGIGPVTVELSQESVTIRAKHRVTRIDWAGVVEVRATSRQIVLRFNAGDATSIPTRLFSDPEHEARFRDLASFCQASSSHEPASRPGVG
jgi:hypothetical protein